MTAVLARLEREAFDRSASKDTTVAVFRTSLLDGISPIAALIALRREGEACFLFESATGGERIGRYSFLGVAPSSTVHDRAGNVMFQPAGLGRGHHGSLLHALRRAGQGGKTARAHGLPRFTGGYVGFLGWDLAREAVGLKRRRLDLDPPPSDGLPDAVFHRFDDVVAFDHAHGTVQLISNVLCGERPGDAWKLAQSRLDFVEERLAGAGGSTVARPAPVLHRSEPRAAKGRFAPAEAIELARRHMASGEVSQLTLSRRHEVETDASALSIYRALRATSPAPYMFFLETAGASVMGASWERVASVAGGKLSLHPVAGARRRGESPEEDRALELDLLENERDRAQHLVGLDQARGIAAEVARLGRVSVDELMTVERFATAMQLVCHVSAQLEPSFDRLDALRACLPGTSVSGVPRRRAVELLDELDGERGLFGGAVGYVGLGEATASHDSGTIDTCVASNFLVQRGRRVLARTPLTVEADTDAARELAASDARSRTLLGAVRLAEEGLRP